MDSCLKVYTSYNSRKKKSFCVVFARFFSILLLFSILCAVNTFASNNPYQVKRDQREILVSASASDVEKATAAWTLINLERLQGNEKEAMIVFKEFEALCSKYLDKDDWKILRAWAKKTKAQEPPL